MHFRIFTFLIVFAFQGALSAQMPGPPGGGSKPVIKGSIKGEVFDSLTNQPLGYASVVLALPGGKMLDGVIADENGRFRFREVNPSKYEIQVTFIGYDPKIISDVNPTPIKPDVDLGRILVMPQGINLDDIMVVEEAPIMESKIDKIVYNADKDLTNIGGDGADVLRKVPLLSVDLEGNVSLRGSNNVTIFINGKPSSMFAGNIADALKSLPSDQIKSVEVITTPTARYDGEGSTGIINIILKKNELKGMTGSVNGSIGTRSNNLDFSLSRVRGRFGINANGGTRFTWMRPGSQSFLRTDSLPGGEVRILEQNGDNRSSWTGFNGTVGMFYDFNALNSINSSVRLNGNRFIRTGTTYSHFEDPALEIIQDYNRFNDDLTLGTGFDWSTDYRKTFADVKDKEWSLSYQLSGRISDESTRIDQQGNPLLVVNQLNENLGLNLEHIIQTDYVLPIGKAYKFETGLKGTLRRMNSDFDYQNYDSNSQTFIPDPATSGAFNYDQDVAAAYVSLQTVLSDKYTMIAGVRYEYTAIKGDPSGGLPAFANNYGSLLPSFILSRKLSMFSSLKVAYSQRIQRPGLRFINPYQQLNDPRNITLGNPTLLPELTNQVELNYNTFVKGSVINASVYYRFTEDIIESFLSVAAEGASVTSYQNIGENVTMGANLFGTTSFFKKKFTVRGSLDVNTYQSTGTVNGTTLSNQDINYQSFLNLSYDFGKGIKGEMFGFFRSQTTTLQGRIPSFWMYSFAFQKEFSKKMSLGLTVIEPFNLNKSFRTNLSGPTFRQESNFSVPFQSIGINFRYAFGKLEGREATRRTRIKSDDLKGGEDTNF
jgi:ferric enterobactin receptor